MRENETPETSFEIFWREYPRRVGKLKALKLWSKFRNDERQKAIEGVKLWKQTAQWHRHDGIFIPYASTFLAQKRYLDEPGQELYGKPAMSGTVTTTRALAVKLAEWVRSTDRATKDVLIEDGLGSVLKKTGLAELLDAGQAMRDCNYINTANSLRWDAALAKLQEALK